MRRAGLYDLARSLKIPLALKDIGMPADGIERVVELALKDPYWNPRPLETEGSARFSGAPMRAARQQNAGKPAESDLRWACDGRRAPEVRRPQHRAMAESGRPERVAPFGPRREAIASR